jgi:hypothetical protein
MARLGWGRGASMRTLLARTLRRSSFASGLTLSLAATVGLGLVSPVAASAVVDPFENYHAQNVLCHADNGVTAGGVTFPSPLFAILKVKEARINPTGYEVRYVRLHFWNKDAQHYDINTGWVQLNIEGDPLLRPLGPNDFDIPHTYAFPFDEDNREFGLPPLRAAHYLVGVTYGWYWAMPGQPWHWVPSPTRWLQYRTAPDSEYGYGDGIFGGSFAYAECDTYAGPGSLTFNVEGVSASSATLAGTPLERLAKIDGALAGDVAPLRAGGMRDAGSPACPKAPTILGTDGPDTLVGTRGRDVIAGLGGDDRIFGLQGADVICGGEGNDEISGGQGDDWASGAAGKDVLLGGQGRDALSAGDGIDIVEGGPGSDSLMGGGQALDIVAYLFSRAAVDVDLDAGTAKGGEGHDKVSGFNAVVGSRFDDRLGGGGGEQWFVPLAGDDIVNGGRGTDVLDFFLSADGITLNLGAGSSTGEGQDRVAGIEVVFGSAHKDNIAGGAANNWIFGDLGDDILSGGAGANTLAGDDGTDTCSNAQFYVSCENQGDGIIGPSLDEGPPAEPTPIS